jgi:hypothetical protein
MTVPPRTALATLAFVAAWAATSVVHAADVRATESTHPVGDDEVAPRTPQAEDKGTDVSQAALSSWPGLSLGWDVRAEAISLFKHYTIGGQGAWYSGQGAGGGASLSLHFRPAAALSKGVLRWVEFELGVSNSTHFVRWEEGERARPSTNFIDNHTSAILGVHIASGRYASSAGEPWSGAVLGLAWVPTYMYFFGNDEFTSGGRLHHAGLRLSIDWGRVSPTAKGLVPGLRASLTWLPYIGSLPSAVSAGVGCVFY